MRSVQEILCVLLNELLLEAGERADHWFCERGIDLQGDLFEFDGCFIIFCIEHPSFLQDHLDDLFVCLADARCPDHSHDMMV